MVQWSQLPKPPTSLRAGAIVLLAGLLAAACAGEAGWTPSEPPLADGGPLDGDDVGCVPQCTGRTCGDDGCGGTCGSCAVGQTCAAGVCSGCVETCASLGHQCGEVCGERCGECGGPDQACVDGRCVCLPTCDVTSCEQDDGCGGTCPACPRDVSCPDCPLRISVVDRQERDGVLREVTLALDFAPDAGAALPGMADLRLSLAGELAPLQVALGPALLEADKTLLVDPQSGKPYRLLADGSLQLVILSTASARSIGAGRWLLLRFRVGAAYGGAAPAPVAVSLLAREQIFAPPSADAALWGTELATPVVLWPEVSR